jgi:predicted dehydrogenase
MPLKTTRRQFAAAPLIVPAAALGLGGATPPSDRVTVGIVGSGQRALFETKQYPWFGNAAIVALSDAQQRRMESGKAELEKLYAEQQPQSPNRGIRMYRDFHELLAQKDIDGVYIASPDHWHVSMLLPALKGGKHVHCEKPLGVSVEQDVAALKAVRGQKKLFWYGAEMRAFPDAKKAIELVLNGRIGQVQKLYVFGPPSVAGGSAGPAVPVPQGWDYDAWLGPAAAHPFCANRCTTDEPRGIFHISDYTLGNIANWAAHPLDQMQRWADAVGRKDPPVHYEGSGKFPESGLYDCATQWNVRCTWADGLTLDFMDNATYQALADAPHPPGRQLPNGAVFVGSEGWVIVEYGRVHTSNPSLMTTVMGPNEKRVPASVLDQIPDSLPKGQQQQLTAAHHQAWIKAIRTGGSSVDGIESAFRSDMISQLSDLCIRTGQPVRWDPAKQTITGNDTARAMMRKAMRSPWGVA